MQNNFLGINQIGLNEWAKNIHEVAISKGWWESSIKHQSQKMCNFSVT